MAKRRRKLGEILRDWRRITDQQLQDALKVAGGSGKRLGDTLVELGYCDDNDVAQALASQHEMEYIDVEQPDAVSKENLKLLPADLIKKHKVLPLGKEDGRLKVLIHDPMDLDTIDNIRFRMNCEIDTALGSRRRIAEYIDRVMSETRESISKAIGEMTVDAKLSSIDIQSPSVDIAGMTVDSTVDRSIDRGASIDVEAEAEDDQAPIIRLVNQIIQEAVNMRASDIHIEPFTDRVRLRYRIDSVCHERDTIPKQTQSAMIARLKIMAGVKIEEKKVPQSGRIKHKVGDSWVDFRFEVSPTYHGEACVLRILRPEAARLGMERLGMRADTLEMFNKLIRRPNGILLVTGPTGSGKTTTLYSALNVLNHPNRKIITAEDPIEYNFKGINQCQVNEQIGLTFSRILRAMLRQAPNIVLVGEIRDQEVANVAIQAALTGHLVFSTLHTNDAPSAITRLVDMGVKPFLVASSIQAVLAQRLVRILCPECKEPDDNPNQRLLRLCGLKPSDVEGRTLYRPVGCPKCGKTGYRGRRGIYELMHMNNDIRDMAFRRAPLNQIRNAAVAAGMRTLLGDGRLKILDGDTTPDEISRITQVEGLVDLAEEEVLVA